MTTKLDCLVIGGGPAGLTAAIYLGRFRRNFVVANSGASRALWIPKSHNHAGFPEGVIGSELVSRMRSQAMKYGARIVSETVSELTQLADGTFDATLENIRINARTVLLATGVIDKEPALPNLFDGVQKGLIRHCGICDGYEVIDHKIAVIGYGETGLGEALFLRNYTSDITLMSLGEPLNLDSAQRRKMQSAGIKTVEEAVTQVEIDGGRIVALTVNGHGTLEFDTLYSALGYAPRSSLAGALGAALENHCVVTDEHQRSTVPNFFVAGDVAKGVDQISVAMGHAAAAATAIHNSLRE